MQKPQHVRQSVVQLRDDTLDHERIRDQYVIHLQQCQDDHNILRQIFKKLKLKLDLAGQDAPPPPEPSSVTHSVPATRRLQTLESIRLTLTITSQSEAFPAGSRRFPYGLRTNSVLCTAQFAPDGARIAFADGNLVSIVESADGEVVSTIDISMESQLIEVMNMKMFLIQFVSIVNLIEMKLVKVNNKIKNMMNREFQVK
jgi:hypothetical protein